MDRLALLLCLFASPVAAGGDDVGVELVDKVLVGAQPELVLKLRRAVTSIEVALTSDGEPLHLSSGAEIRGATVRLPIAAPLGVTHYQGELKVTFADGGTGEMPLTFAVEVVEGLNIDAPPQQLDTTAGTLTLTLSRPAARCQHIVSLASGATLKGSTRFAGEPAGTPLTVRWKPSKNSADVRKVRVECFDNDGFSRAVELVPTPAPDLEVPHDQLDLRAGTLKARMSKNAVACAVDVTYETPPVVHSEAKFESAPPGTWLALSWAPRVDVTLRVALHCSDPTGAAATLELFPWQLEVPHEEVNFASDRSEVTREEAPKLDRARQEIATAVRRYGRVISITLYVVGYTDTQGNREHNSELSQQRARAIATYFRQHGVKIPIRALGLGEDEPAVATPDETDEPRNRRARYVLSVEPPFAGGWQPIK